MNVSMQAEDARFHSLFQERQLPRLMQSDPRRNVVPPDYRRPSYIQPVSAPTSAVPRQYQRPAQPAPAPTSARQGYLPPGTPTGAPAGTPTGYMPPLQREPSYGPKLRMPSEVTEDGSMVCPGSVTAPTGIAPRTPSPMPTGSAETACPCGEQPRAAAREAGEAQRREPAASGLERGAIQMGGPVNLCQLLRESIGYYIITEHLVGTCNLVHKEGLLIRVEPNCFVLYDEATRSILVCDYYSLKFFRRLSYNERPVLITFDDEGNPQLRITRAVAQL